HFPAPWRAVKTHDGYVVRDANDQALAYIYSHENETDARRFNELTSDEARRIALVLAALPELLVGDPGTARGGGVILAAAGPALCEVPGRRPKALKLRTIFRAKFLAT